MSAIAYKCSCAIRTFDKVTIMFLFDFVLMFHHLENNRSDFSINCDKGMIQFFIYTFCLWSTIQHTVSKGYHKSPKGISTYNKSNVAWFPWVGSAVCCCSFVVHGALGRPKT